MLREECSCRCCDDKMRQCHAADRAYEMRPRNGARERTRLKEWGQAAGYLHKEGAGHPGWAKRDALGLRIRL